MLLVGTRLVRPTERCSLLRLTLLLRGPKHSTSEHKQENRNYSDALPEPKKKSHDTSLVGVAARRMMPKIASFDASMALETIACRAILGVYDLSGSSTR
jgi:hypothetical protein